jgi:hypothetical protein
VLERPLKLRERHPILLVHLPALLVSAAIVAYLELGVLHGQWWNWSAYVLAFGGLLVSEVVLNSGLNSMERFFEWYERQSPFTRLRVKRRSRTERGRSNDR